MDRDGIVKRVTAAVGHKRSRTNTRARLLEAASEVFADMGYQAASVEDVCAAAGFTRGAFYSNFTSKDELFLALWDGEAERLTGAVADLVAEVGAGRLDLDRAAASLGVLSERRWFQLNTEFLLHALRDAGAARALARRRAHLRSALGTLLAALLDDAGLELPDGVDLDTFTRMVIATHEGTQHQALVEPTAAGALETTMVRDLFSRCPPR